MNASPQCYVHKEPCSHGPHPGEHLRLECVIACVGFDDLLDVTLPLNHPHFDTIIVVTAHHDRKTQHVAHKHGAICVQTDLFRKNGRNFNKGAALNAGFGRFQYHGWRQVLDADIVCPDNYRRVLFNHSHLDPACIYGADRANVYGIKELKELFGIGKLPQHIHGAFVSPQLDRATYGRYVDTLRGYVPLGFFQLWNAVAQKEYPWSLGSAEHDDVAFAEQWALEHRRLLPGVICFHVCSRKPVWGENWDGHRRQPRLE